MTRISAALRRKVRREAGDVCEYCRSSAELTGHDFTVDHIAPQSRGVAPVCRICAGVVSGATVSSKRVPRRWTRGLVIWLPFFTQGKTDGLIISGGAVASHGSSAGPR